MQAKDLHNYTVPCTSGQLIFLLLALLFHLKFCFFFLFFFFVFCFFLPFIPNFHLGCCLVVVCFGCFFLFHSRLLLIWCLGNTVGAHCQDKVTDGFFRGMGHGHTNRRTTGLGGKAERGSLNKSSLAEAGLKDGVLHGREH